jgi:putative zinc finger/helix-turn-helix YgiT family protein
VTEVMRTPEPFPWLCSRCAAEKVFPEKITYETTLRYEGRNYQLVVAEVPALKCKDCGETLLNNESDDFLARAFRDELKLLQPENIREGRKLWNLNQREFAEVLGVAEESISRWETGAQMQSRVVDKIMRVYFASPEARAVLAAAKTDATIGTGVVNGSGGNRLDERIANCLGHVAQRLQSIPLDKSEPLVENFERLLDIWKGERPEGKSARDR